MRAQVAGSEPGPCDKLLRMASAPQGYPQRREGARYTFRLIWVFKLRRCEDDKKCTGDALSDILKGMCVPSPVVVHNDMPINNIVAGIQGLEKRAEMVEAYRRRRWGATAAKHTADTRK